MEPHLTPEQLGAFLGGACGAVDAHRVETHIDACDECRAVLSSLVRGQPTPSSTATVPDSLAQTQPSPKGGLVSGKYRVERTLGAGGMGTVMSAWHEQLNQRVALKFMLPTLALDAVAVARFQREARAAVRLQSPHVGRVLDLDALPDGTPFLVMEYLEGETADQRLTRERTLPVETVVSWARAVLGALEEAHALGIIHRDLKPANLFLAKRPGGSEVVKVLDFGIAKSDHPDIEKGLGTTSAGMVVGSPPYMAPEQLDPRKEVDARADLWSLGVSLYQLVSGKLPFTGANLVDLMYAVQNLPHPPLQGVAPETPGWFCDVVDGCLAKAPAARPASATALLGQLERGLAAGTAGASGAADEGRRRRRLLLGALAGAAALAGVGVLVFALATAPPPAPSSTEAQRSALPPSPTLAGAAAPGPEQALRPSPAPPEATPARVESPAAPLAPGSPRVPPGRPKVGPGAATKSRPGGAKPAAPADDVFRDRR